MRIADWLRVLLVIGAATAALASAKAQQNQQKGYYPKPPPAAPPLHAQPGSSAPPDPMLVPGRCEHYCSHIANCSIEPYPACVASCRESGREQHAEGREQLATYARSTCEQLVVLLHQPRGP
jgi:hypothetical protein